MSTNFLSILAFVEGIEPRTQTRGRLHQRTGASIKSAYQIWFLQ